MVVGAGAGAGAGAAGNAAAERLREDGFTGQLHLVGAEVHRPYNRTPLSKQLLTGELTPADLDLPVFTDLAATWHLGVTATALNLDRHEVALSTGEQLGYDGLVLAVGVAPRVLPEAPLHTEHVHLLRTLDDAHAIERSLSGTTGRVVIVSGGFIGCELASTARARGLDATIVDVSPALLRHGLGEVLGDVATALHAAAGVRLHLGVGVRSWETHDAGVRLLLDDGERIDADLAVVGVGTDPHVGWLDGSGLENTQGIAANATCHALRTDGTVVDSVVVAGDAARWPNLRFDTTPPRVEHWINAIEMGQAAATNLLTGPDTATPFTPVPRFWSAQHDVHIQSAGMPALADTVTVIAGSLTSRRVLTAHTTTLPDGAHLLVGLIAFDHTQALLDATGLIGDTVTLPAPDQLVRPEPPARTPPRPR